MNESKKLTAEAYQAAQERLKAAVKELNALCNGQPFRLSIPVQDNDSDQIIGGSLHDLGMLRDHIDAMEAEYQAGMQRAIDDAFRQAEVTTTFIDEQTARIEASEGVLEEVLANARMIVETQTEIKLPHWQLINMIVTRIEAHKKANGPG